MDAQLFFAMAIDLPRTRQPERAKCKGESGKQPIHAICALDTAPSRQARCILRPAKRAASGDIQAVHENTAASALRMELSGASRGKKRTAFSQPR